MGEIGGNALDGIHARVRTAPLADQAAIAAVRQRDRLLTKPPGSLGRLEAIVEWLAAWQGKSPPVLESAAAVVFAGNHGVAKHGVSAYPAEVTAQMVANFEAGGAAINQIAKANGLKLSIVPIDLDRPTADIIIADAMSVQECAAAVNLGASVAAADLDLLCIGEMGIGNTTPASAILQALFGGPAHIWVGPGTGVERDALTNKIRAVESAVARVIGTDGTSPLEFLRRLGGREIAALVGAIIEARHRRIPVLIDGFVATAAAAVVHAIEPGAIDHCLIGHLSAEPAHRRAVQALGKTPILELNMRLGEASGAALAAGIVRSALAVHTGMATFAEAGVTDRQT
ncbi:nicotinate-nucleotide--dimethylbenzimidazole phosphoribosyltransferase [Methylorubrum extorquens]|uniref:Nicotinate-nucleotide--dimethylbenzimidazole phosphoribosyltransferase n=1 Tax=Methylorubrum extorquens (strain CM4 / NCIMB 13688) TaxID=440085 RepID=COBT_METC4|nr:nicotinate-nucleotide--dimethylbenzimidazole phosphoribosyltransferase [Methylorubrum extorquens]Q9X7F4.1 RecName: Full=Nicotinate-nucleotide--dimethylbenzimidazole phosphoribosyltransferase; Short=NN:DBI PRT; AltName: Full=N(1)-alpha-phosphoribosyltransferase [Methylorubrum extorquens CM4]ACK86420.1 nicotinate-nucleotide/dimethylbenzimidazole phosphoribosyltransferase [Methylorubrum extorquens CM4]CAB39398.1 CobU protein [Methylorubrum extorquens CM4]